MKKEKRIAKIYTFLIGCVVLCLNSCGHEEEPVTPENAPDGTEIPVSIVTPMVTPQLVGDEKPVRYAHITQGNVAAAVEVERVLDTPDDQKLSDGIHYRVVAYKKNGNSHSFHESKDFVAGSNAEITLNKSQSYTIIMYSFGSKDEVPDLGDRDNFEKAYVEADYKNDNAKDLLYMRIDFVPNGGNSVNTKLVRKIPSIALTLDASDFYGGNLPGNITELRDVSLTYHTYEKATISINNDGVVSFSGKNQVALDDLVLKDVNGKKRASGWNNLVLNPREKVSFNAMINVDGEDRPVPYKIDIPNIKAGIPQIINLKLERCGVDLGALGGGWRQFMCYDLGSDYSAYPFKADEKLHGNKYQWGDTYHISPSEDKPEYIQGWVEHPGKELGHPWGNDSSNPCPQGYRVPTAEELQELSKNDFVKVGNLTSDNVYDKGFELKDKNKGKLFLPAAGFRAEIVNGVIMNRGEGTVLWSGSEYGIEGVAYALQILPNEGVIENHLQPHGKRSGMSVRCIKNSL